MGFKNSHKNSHTLLFEQQEQQSRSSTLGELSKMLLF
jgi:hypothetical protein